MRQILVDDLYEGEVRATQAFREILDHLEDAMKRVPFEWSDYCDTQKSIVVTVRGQQMSMRYDTAMAIKMHLGSDKASGRPDNLAHLFRAGQIEIEDNIVVLQDVCTTLEDLWGMIGQLTAKQLAMCELADEVIVQKMASLVNAMLTEMEWCQGCQPATHWPIEKANCPEQEQGPFMLLACPCQADDRVKIIPFFRQLLDCVQVASYSHGMAVPLHNAFVLWIDDAMKNTFKKNGREREYALIVEKLRDMQHIAYGSEYIDSLRLQKSDSTIRRVLADRARTLAVRSLAFRYF